jgi:hypothetical protein
MFMIHMLKSFWVSAYKYSIWKSEPEFVKFSNFYEKYSAKRYNFTTEEKKISCVVENRLNWHEQLFLLDTSLESSFWYEWIILYLSKRWWFLTWLGGGATYSINLFQQLVEPQFCYPCVKLNNSYQTVVYYVTYSDVL